MGKDYYSILGVERGADDKAIRNAYRKAAVKWHPDKNPDNKEAAEKKFKEIAEAYDVLSNPETRAVFDRYGEEGLKYGGPPPQTADQGGAGSPPQHGGGPQGFHYQFNGDPNEIFAEFFKHQSGGMRRQRSGMNSFSGAGFFDDLMGGGGFGMGGGGFGMGGGMGGADNMGRGTQRSPAVKYPLACTLEELFHGCTKRLKLQRKNMTMQRPTEKTIEVQINKGWKAGTKLTYKGEGDEYAPGSCQDVIIVVEEKNHPRFAREGSDLVVHTSIPLVDALTGFKLDVHTLDNRHLRINIKDVVHSKYSKVIKGEGMPLSKDPGTRGDLVLTFDVVFPKSLSEEQKQSVRRSLPRA